MIETITSGLVKYNYLVTPMIETITSGLVKYNYLVTPMIETITSGLVKYNYLVTPMIETITSGLVKYNYLVTPMIETITSGLVKYNYLVKGICITMIMCECHAVNLISTTFTYTKLPKYLELQNAYHECQHYTENNEKSVQVKVDSWL